MTPEKDLNTVAKKIGKSERVIIMIYGVPLMNYVYSYVLMSKYGVADNPDISSQGGTTISYVTT